MGEYTYLIPTLVQSGESIGYYSELYGCSDEDIRKANGIKGDKIKAGQTLNIPIGEPVTPLPTNNDSVLDKKLSWFNNMVNEVHMQLYDPNLPVEEREKLEAEYQKLKEQKQKRDEMAEITKAGNGINLVVNMKKPVLLKDFLALFPECEKAGFYDYAERTDQLDFPPSGSPYPYDKTYVEPLNVGLNSGDKIMLKAEHFARDDGDGFWRSVKKTLGWRLDGK